MSTNSGEAGQAKQGQDGDEEFLAALRQIVPVSRLTPALAAECLAIHHQCPDRQKALLQAAALALSQLDRKLSETAGRQAEIEIEMERASRMAADLKASLGELSLLNDSSLPAPGHDTLQEALERCLSLFWKTLPASALSILLVDQETRAFITTTSRGLTPALEEEAMTRMEEGVFAWAIRQGGPIVMPLTTVGHKSLVVVPMMAERMPIGVACIFSSLAVTEYTPNTFEVLRQISRRESAAIDATRRIQGLEHQAAEAQDMRNYLDRLVDSLAEGILVIDAENRVTVFNRTAELIFGCDASALRGHPYQDCLPFTVARLLRELLARARRDDPALDYEFDFDRGEGVLFRLGFSSALLRDASEPGRDLGVLVTVRDLSTARELVRLRRSDQFKTAALNRIRDNLREAEERANRSEKLASIGQMAAGVAHEINNPLGSIAGFIQIILMDLEAESPHREYLEAMQKEVGRMKRIVDDLLDFARQRPEDSRAFLPVDINMLVEETLRLSEPQARIKRVRTLPGLDPSQPLVQGNADRIKQTLFNICLNAFAAMNKDDNILRVSTHCLENERGKWVDIAIADNGGGIRQEHMAKIFDPFFTTREQGKGTGLGLSTSYSIVQQHGGEILVDSAWGEGTTFTVRLPLASNQPELPSADGEQGI